MDSLFALGHQAVVNAAQLQSPSHSHLKFLSVAFPNISHILVIKKLTVILPHSHNLLLS